jgi:hypothetical protein
MAQFKVNQFTTIKNFVLLNEFTEFIKFGLPSIYQKFTGKIDKKDVTGWQCLSDLNIYKLEYIN